MSQHDTPAEVEPLSLAQITELVGAITPDGFTHVEGDQFELLWDDAEVAAVDASLIEAAPDRFRIVMAYADQSRTKGVVVRFSLIPQAA